MNFKIIGGILVAWGVVDFGLSYAGTDVWADWIGVNLWEINELLGKYIAWMEIIIGSVIWKISDAGSDDADEVEE